jgi:uncharacterized repeat protein (TIGR02543 family)
VSSAVFETNGTVNVMHKDAVSGAVLSSSTFSVPAGVYGPYGPQNFSGYGTGILAVGSAPASGTITAGETKTITYQYSPMPQTGTINVIHKDATSGAVLSSDTYTVPAGNYGPYSPQSFSGYGTGSLASGSAPAFGTISAGETKTITYQYSSLPQTGTVIVIHVTDAWILLDQANYVVPVGTYGPYGPLTFSGYGTGILVSGSASPFGTIAAGETKTIIYQYSLLPQTGTINVIHKDAVSGAILSDVTHTVSPGAYGPYGPQTFANYGVGVLAVGSAPASGTINAGETKTITYQYFRLYTVIVNDSYGAQTGAGQYVAGATVAINAGSRSGYAFSGWTVDAGGITLPNTAIVSFVMPSADVTVTANWVPLQYSISYMLNGGVNAVGNPAVYTVESAFPVGIADPSLTGYAFRFWRIAYDDGSSATLPASGIPVGTVGDVVLSAVWNPIPIEYPVIYMLNDGVNAPGNPSYYTVIDHFPISIANPTKSGYVFFGWLAVYANGSQSALMSSYSIPVGTTGAVTLFAIWDSTPVSYSILYVLNGGVNAVGNPAVYTVESAFPIGIADPVRDGFMFQGWLASFANGTELMLPASGIPVGTVGDVVLSAVWDTTRGAPVVAPSVYSIVYELDGGVNAVGNPVTYSAVGDFPIGVANPSKVGVSFLCWFVLCTDGTAYILPSSGIAAGVTGDLTLFAIWV